MIYSPSDDSFLLEKEVKRYSKEKSVLDIGSGSGIQAKAARQAGAKSVLATDINPEAVKHLKKQKINAIKSDLFENVKGKFDLIIFNPPYLPEDVREPKQSRLATTGGKRGDEIILKFLKSAKKYLNKNGAILIVLSSLGPKDRIHKLLKDKKLRKTVISKKKIFMETLEVWEIQRQKT